MGRFGLGNDGIAREREGKRGICRRERRKKDAF
jgi:hypothetical protein